MDKDGLYIINTSVLLFCLIMIPHALSYRGLPCANFSATKKDQYFMYPRTPNVTYGKNEHLCWRFKAFNPHKHVKLTFKSFMLEKHPTCSHDNISIYDGAYGKSSALIDVFCGSRRPHDIISVGDILYIEFHSDNSEEYGGFSLKYVAGSKDELKDDNDDEPDDKKYYLTTKIVGGIIGGLVFVTVIVVIICVCTSSRRCACRPGSGTVDPDGSTRHRSNRNRRNRRQTLTRTDRVGLREIRSNRSLPQIENPVTVLPIELTLPTYTEPSAPPPYIPYVVTELQRLPSSPPPPYSPNDPNPFFVSLGDINVPDVPGIATSRF